MDYREIQLQERMKYALALENADSTDEMLKIFNKMENSKNPRFTQQELDLYCSLVANKLYTQGKDFEKILYFGKRGLRYMLNGMGKDSTNKIPCLGYQKLDLNNATIVFREDGSVGISSITSNNYHYGMEFLIPSGLNMLGSVCCELKMFSESLSYYNWAVRNLTMLLRKDCPDGCFLKKLEMSYFGLFKLKRAMGRVEEGLPFIKKFLECKQKRLKEGSVELGEAYKGVYEAYFDANEFKEALPLLLKALEFHRMHFGGESVEVAEMLSSLGSIYGSFGDLEKAREQNALAMRMLRKVTPNSPKLLEMEIGDGNTLICLGRCKEAIEVFRNVLERTDAKGIDRARAFGGMAIASVNMGKFADTKKFIRAAQRIYEKERMNPLYAAVAFEYFSKMYEKMNDLETSISFIRRTLKVPKLPEKLLVEASWRLFSLYSLADNEEEGIPYMQDAIENLKESLGPEHLQVAYGYGKLGRIYTDSAQEELGVKLLEKAKEIMDVSLGPGHLDSMKTTHQLALTYSRLGRLELAIELEEKVVIGCKDLGQSGIDLMTEAVMRLNEFKGISSAPEWAITSAMADQLGV